MSQLGEAIAAFFGFDDKEEKIEKKPIKIRVSLFFDGTLNNRTNLEQREKHETGQSSASYKEEGDGGQNSYDNGRTNIALLEPSAPNEENQKGKTGYDYVFKLYVEGQGTFNNEGDSFFGYSMGAGASGVASRAKQGINRAFEKIEVFLEKYAYAPEEYFLEKIDVDVFGFSRGAATARHSIYLLSDKGWEYTVPLHARLRYLGYEEITEKNVEVVFAGVYDTVISVNASQYNWWADNKLNQRAIALAKKSVHLAAADEHRQDFPLHTIKSAKDKGTGKELYLPGVHSDVGGSYNLANEQLENKRANEASIIKITIASGSYRKMEAKRDELIAQKVFTANQLDIVVTKTVSVGRNRQMSKSVPSEGKLVELRTIHGPELMRVSSEVNRIINKGYVVDLVADRDRLVKQGWYKLGSEIAIHVVAYDEFGQAFGNLVVSRLNIKSAYSNIPLKIMAEFSRENGVKLSSKIEDKANTILNKHSDLLKLESKIKKYVGSVGNASKPEDWIDDLSIKDIRHDHLHMSSKSGVGYSPRMRKNKRVRYYYDG